MPLRQWPALLLLTVAACGGSDLSSTTTNGNADTEVEEALRTGPRYTLESPEIFGDYASDDGCAGGFDVCYSVKVRRSGDKVEVVLGDESFGAVVAPAWMSRGSVLFSVDGLEGDCDDPGCGNLQKISGVIYPVKKGTKWVPQVKASIVADFPFPDEQEAPSGEVKSVVRYKKK
ncbi:MAG: hypothetical protein IPG50_08185 [Myxococcales bacterium]|nr:hypothetical protein [Myxococcales bacterium]